MARATTSAARGFGAGGASNGSMKVYVTGAFVVGALVVAGGGTVVFGAATAAMTGAIVDAVGSGVRMIAPATT